MGKDAENIISDFVDYLLPELTPYEFSLYVLLFKKSFIENGTNTIRIGKRTIADNYTKGTRGDKTNYASITKFIKSLEEKEFIKVGDTNTEGTSYIIISPKEIPLIKKKLSKKAIITEVDYFNDYEKRQELFNRDNWVCFYCGGQLNKDNATLDHYIPQSKGGKHTKENLKTCCLLCNSIKSGKTYEEAAPLLLKRITEKRNKR